MSEKWEGGQWEQCAWRVSIMPCQSWLQSCQEELFPHRTTPPLSHEPFFSWYNKYWMKLEEQYVVLGKKRQDFPNNVCSHDRKKLTLIGATQFDTVADPATFSSFSNSREQPVLFSYGINKYLRVCFITSFLSRPLFSWYNTLLKYVMHKVKRCNAQFRGRRDRRHILFMPKTNKLCLSSKKLSLQKDDILSYCGGPCHCSSFKTVENSQFYSVMG